MSSGSGSYQLSLKVWEFFRDNRFLDNLIPCGYQAWARQNKNWEPDWGPDDEICILMSQTLNEE